MIRIIFTNTLNLVASLLLMVITALLILLQTSPVAAENTSISDYSTLDLLHFETAGIDRPVSESNSDFSISSGMKLDTNEIPVHDNRRALAHGVIGTGFAVYLVYGYYVFWQDVEYQEFTVSDWNDTHQREYAGGADKVSHAFGGYFITRTCSQLYEWSGMSQKRSAWTGFAISQAFLLLGEIEDGFTIIYGFDPQDLAANIVGGLIGVAEEIYPEFDALFDFRVSYWPSREYRLHENYDNVAEDYSGLTFYLVLKPASLLENPSESWLRFFELVFGFGSKGYLPGYDFTAAEPTDGFEPYYRERELQIGISLNIREVFHFFLPEPQAGVTRIVSSTSNFFFEYYQHPLYLAGSQTLSSYKGYYRTY